MRRLLLFILWIVAAYAFLRAALIYLSDGYDDPLWYSIGVLTTCVAIAAQHWNDEA